MPETHSLLNEIARLSEMERRIVDRFIHRQRVARDITAAPPSAGERIADRVASRERWGDRTPQHHSHQNETAPLADRHPPPAVHLPPRHRAPRHTTAPPAGAGGRIPDRPAGFGGSRGLNLWRRLV